MVRCNNIYGVNPDDDINPCMVRDAIVECFFEAHTEELKQLFQISDLKSDKNKEMSKKHIILLIKKMFDEVNGDFNNPTKESLIDVVEKCKEFAGFFRDKEIIKKHATEIMTLINKLE